MDIIIGAGVTGLGYAAHTESDYLIIEREKEIGGYCRTFHEQGFVWDFAGHFFHFQHEDLRRWVMSRIADDEIVNVEKQTQIIYGGRHVDYPFQMNIHQLEQQEFIDCLVDLFDNPYAEQTPESFRQMLYAKFGRSIAEKFLIPYNTKLYATDLDRLDVDAMGRFFPYANREQIVRNFRRSDNSSYNSRFLYPRSGCMRIVESVAEHVDASRISTGEAVVAIDMERHQVETTQRTIAYDRLISTMPFPTLLTLCNIDYDAMVYSWNKVLVFNLGFDSKGTERKNDWIYFPERDLVFYRVGFYDNILSQDRMSLYVEIGYSHDATVPSEEELLPRVIEDLKRVGVVTTQQLVAHNSLVMDPAYVHITRRSEADKAAKMKKLAECDIYSIGRYGEWKYCSLEDNLHDARLLAQKLNMK